MWATWGEFFSEPPFVPWTLPLILIVGHVVGTVVSFNTICKVIIGFSLPKCREKRDCSSFCNQMYSVHLAVTLSGSAVSHTWYICNDYLKEDFKNRAKISMCVRQAGEWRGDAVLPERYVYLIWCPKGKWVNQVVLPLLTAPTVTDLLSRWGKVTAGAGSPLLRNEMISSGPFCQPRGVPLHVYFGFRYTLKCLVEELNNISLVRCRHWSVLISIHPTRLLLLSLDLLLLLSDLSE